jgi:RNAse (barnase) inhibitor barstar
VHASEEGRLREDLQAAGFSLAILEGRELHHEKDLLQSLGRTFRFPSYYGVNWDAFTDCAGDMADAGGHVALVWTAADVLLQRDLHGFVRAVHLLLGTAREISSLGDWQEAFQLELFLVGEQEAFRNHPPPEGTVAS